MVDIPIMRQTITVTEEQEMKTRFSVERIDHVGQYSRDFQGRAGFNAHFPNATAYYRVLASVVEGSVTSMYTVAEFYPSQIEGEFATDGEAAANEYAAALNRKGT